MTHSPDRSPIISEHNPSWEYDEPITNRTMTYTVGYITKDRIPVMALFAGQSSVEPILIPLDIMVHAIEEGADAQERETI